MAYRFKLNEKVRDGVVRIAHEQFDRARGQLAHSTEIERSVHETRKCLKRIRALLRLVRPGIKDETFKHENAALREIGGLLSEARDSHVLLQSIAKLEAERPDIPFINVRRLALAGARNGKVKEAPNRMGDALSALLLAQQRFDDLKIAPGNFAILQRGYERAYAHGRRATVVAYKQDSAHAFHELRKHVQRHWRQSQLLSRAWPEVMEAHAMTAREISQILGDDHDLAVLEAYVAGAPKGEIGKEEAKGIRNAIRERQQVLRALALPRLQRLFADPPEDLGRRVVCYWKTAKKINKEEHILSACSSASKEPQGAYSDEATTDPRPGRAA